MPKIDIVNLIPYHARTAKEPEALTGLTPRKAAERVRESCSEKGSDFRAWSRGILEHCIIPPKHPYRVLLTKRKVANDDPLWVLGAIAYGTQSPWIAFRRIVWEDGKFAVPDELEREWILKQGTL